MVPYLHVRFSLLKKEKSPHICFDCEWKNLFQMLPILSDSVLPTFSEWEEKATVTLEEAVISIARYHLHADCIAKGQIVKYTIGPFSEQVFGSKKVAMSNYANGTLHVKSTSGKRCPLWAQRPLPTCLLTGHAFLSYFSRGHQKNIKKDSQPTGSYILTNVGNALSQK